MALPKAKRDTPNEWDSFTLVDIHLKGLSPAQKSANNEIADQGIFCDDIYIRIALSKAERDPPIKRDSFLVVDIHIKSLSPAQKSANTKIAYQGIICDVIFGWPCQRPNEIHQTSGTLS